MKPILFCDFDGVINQFPYRWKKETDGSHNKEIEYDGHMNYGFFHNDFDGEKFFRADEFVMLPTHKGTFPISYSTEMVDRLRNLIIEDKVEFVWLSTWREEAVNLLNPMFGFPEHVNYMEWFQKMSDYSQAGKRWALMYYMNNMPEQAEHKVVWLDDVATKPYFNWTAEHGFVELPSFSDNDFPNERLVIKTDEIYGLSRAELDAIEAFVG